MLLCYSIVRVPVRELESLDNHILWKYGRVDAMVLSLDSYMDNLRPVIANSNSDQLSCRLINKIPEFL